LRYCWHSYYSF